MSDNGKFTMKYSAPTQQERREIEDIKRSYQEPEQNVDKFARLKQLDQLVKRLPCVVSLTMGIVGTLLFGLGLTMVLEWQLFVWGVVLAAVGCVPIALAYPIHNVILGKRKAKYKDEILKLSDELLGQDD